MFRLIAVTLAAIYCTMLIGGNRAEDAAVARADTSDVFDFSLASFITPASAETAEPARLSDEKAIALALAAGAAHRADRDTTPELRGLIDAVEAEPTEAEMETIRDLWYVSGTMVNLRAGPGTGNEVVARLSLGTETEVLGDPNADWIEIQTVDGAVSGWIYGKYLSERSPG